MSAEVGRVRGHRHPIFVSVSDGGVELIIEEEGKVHFGDGMTPQTARGLAALLVCAAKQHEKRVQILLKKTAR
jgi:hypothetical protein